MKILALNGPPRVGKTTMAKWLRDSCNFVMVEPSAAFKDAAHQLFGVEFQDEIKDTPLHVLGGKTPRDLYIDIATVVEEYDQAIWVKRAVTDSIRISGGRNDNIYVIDALGKQKQLDWLESFAGQYHIDLYVIAISRPGFTFTDGREAVVGGHRTKSNIMIRNDKTLMDLRMEFLAWMKGNI